MGAAFSYFWSKPEKKILLLGLDNAGKTTILYNLNLGSVITTTPTVGFNVESVDTPKVSFRVWDLGGQSTIIPYWRCYFDDTACLIFVIDTSDNDRLDMAYDRLKIVVEDPSMTAPYVAIFANKQDLENVVSVSSIATKISRIIPPDRSWRVFATSAHKNRGINDGIQWLVQTMHADSNNIRKSWLFR